MNLNLQKKAKLKTEIEEAKLFAFRFPSSVFPCSGFTLTELMVAAGVGSLVLTALTMIFVTSARSFATLGNYTSMNICSRNALDHLTREIRRAGALTDFSSTPTAARLQFQKSPATNSFVIYQWDADSRQLTEWMTGNTTTNVLLTECDALAFTLCKNTFAPTTVPAEGKVISVSWNCSRTILGKKATTESIQQALIVIRNPR
jgi:prepilin-type N-terminal cleavage/methylation domain-containing protein